MSESMNESNAKLVAALEREERKFSDAIDRLRELATPETENEVYDLTSKLRLSVCLVGGLRRMLDGRTVQEVHRAFGAPGDFGYDAPIGAALNDIYRGTR